MKIALAACVIAAACEFLTFTLCPPAFSQVDIIAQAEATVPTRSLPADVVPEEGCPVSVMSIRAELELDPFGAPRASRLYIDYKNNGQKTISAVKFRVRNTDELGKDRGTFHAPHQALVPPDGKSSEKWRHERVDPRTVAMKVRVLQARFTDGSMWQSSQMGGVAAPPPEAGGLAEPAASASPEAPPEAAPKSPDGGPAADDQFAGTQ